MKKVHAAIGLLVALGAAALACAGSDGAVAPASSSSGGAGTNPTNEDPIVAPPTLKITATFLSATLADDCGPKGAPSFGDCAPEPGGGGCGVPCQQSNMQISFASSGDEPASIEIVGVSLRDTEGAELETLTARAPKVWKDGSYVPWDAVVPAHATLKTSYDLSAPSWSTIEANGRFAYQTMYRLRVTMKVNGRLLTIESSDLTREPPVVT